MSSLVTPNQSNFYEPTVDVNYINPFIRQTIHVFDAMLGWKLVRTEVLAKKTFTPNYEISGVIGLSGKVSGVVLLSFSRELACRMVGALMGAKMVTINSDVADLVGELTHTIAGRAASDLLRYDIRTSLPTVVVGRTRTISFPAKINRIIVINFETPLSPIALEVGLVPNPNYRPRRAGSEKVDEIESLLSTPPEGVFESI